MKSAEQFLPTEVLARASVRGSEFAWPISEIPSVIQAARRQGLVNVGGQLQCRIPKGPTCECYWIEINTYKALSQTISNWYERVERSAEVALKSFEGLLSACDFIEEVRKACPKALSDFEASGGDISDTICFVWYLEAENDSK